MPSMARVVVVGHAGRDAETQTTSKGTQVTNFSVAVTQGWGQRKSTGWYRVAAYGKLAEWAGRIRKGGLVSVSGRLEQRTWEDKEGHKNLSVEIIADEVLLLERRSEPAPQDETEGGPDSEDIPF